MTQYCLRATLSDAILTQFPKNLHMPRTAPPTELDQLLALVAAQPDGMRIEAIAQALGDGLKRRTLQRRLAVLVVQGRIQRVGEARAARYVPTLQAGAGAASRLAPMLTPEASAEAYVPVSPEGEEIKAYVRQPRAMRRPVGYQLAFLEDYQPNHTAYLPEKLREQLHAMGRARTGQAPAGTFARDILNRLLIDLSWASSQLEGNTYSRLDTERLIELGQAAEGKNALETQMILNHKLAIEYLVLNPAHAQVTPDCVVALHAFLSDGLMADPTAVGRLRRRAVEIGGSV